MEAEEEVGEDLEEEEDPRNHQVCQALGLLKDHIQLLLNLPPTRHQQRPQPQHQLLLQVLEEDSFQMSPQLHWELEEVWCLEMLWVIFPFFENKIFYIFFSYSPNILFFSLPLLKNKGGLFGGNKQPITEENTANMESKNGQQQFACQAQFDNFGSCLNANASNISNCQWAYDALTQCNQSKQYWIITKTGLFLEELIDTTKWCK